MPFSSTAFLSCVSILQTRRIFVQRFQRNPKNKQTNKLQQNKFNLVNVNVHYSNLVKVFCFDIQSFKNRVNFILFYLFIYLFIYLFFVYLFIYSAKYRNKLLCLPHVIGHLNSLLCSTIWTNLFYYL